MTARDVELYAEITGDRNPLHFDAEFRRGHAVRPPRGPGRDHRGDAQRAGGHGPARARHGLHEPGLRYLAPTYLGDTLTAEVEVLAVKPDKPVCQLRATITNQDGTVVLEGECWTYTMRPVGPRNAAVENLTVIERLVPTNG